MVLRKAHDPNFDWRILPPGTTKLTFDAPSGPLAVATWGEPTGIPALMIPGISGSKEDFSLVGPTLGANGYYAWSVDLAGQYQSYKAGPDSNGKWSPGLHRADIEAILNHLGPAHVVGYSFSAIIAQQIAVEKPELLRSLVLQSSPPNSGDGFKYMRIVGPISWAIPSKVGSAGLLLGLRFNLNRVDPNRAKFVRHRLRYTIPQSISDGIEAMHHIPNMEDELHRLDIPIMSAAGSLDLWPFRHHRAYAKRIGAQLYRYRAGHAPSETTPIEFTEDLLEFWRRAESADELIQIESKA